MKSGSWSRNLLAAVVPLAMLIGGCETTAPLAPADEIRASTVGAQSASPKLQSGDKVKVTVFGEDRLTGEYEIDPGGYVSLPLAGTVKAGGLTKIELERELVKKFRGPYLRDPKVTVDVSTFRPIYVLGEVQKPGEYAFKSGLNVVSALAVAGGNTYRANNNYVLIQRAGESGFKQYPLSPSILVAPGDLIRVPQRYF